MDYIISVGKSGARQLKLRCAKYTAGIINANTAVYIAGYDDTNKRLLVEIASNDDSNKFPMVGIIESEITDVTSSWLVLHGPVYNYDTSSFDINDQLFLGLNGELTNIEPTANIQAIAQVASISATIGIVILNIDAEKVSSQLNSLADGSFWKGNSQNLPEQVNFNIEVLNVINNLKGQANGIAELDATIKLPEEQLPDINGGWI